MKTVLFDFSLGDCLPCTPEELAWAEEHNLGRYVYRAFTDGETVSADRYKAGDDGKRFAVGGVLQCERVTVDLIRPFPTRAHRAQATLTQVE